MNEEEEMGQKKKRKQIFRMTNIIYLHIDHYTTRFGVVNFI